MTLGRLGPGPVGMRHHGSPGPRSCALSRAPSTCARENTGAGHRHGRYGPGRPDTELRGGAREGSRAGKRSGPSSAGWSRPLPSSLWGQLRTERGRSLQQEARSSPLATESGKGTETRSVGAERPPRAREARRAREAPPADCHVGGLLKAGLPAARYFLSGCWLLPTPPRLGPAPPPRPPRPPAAGPAATMKKFFQEIKADIKFKSAGPGQKLTESVGERAPKEKPTQPTLQQARQGPTDEAQMAAAAALARLEQKQPRARGPTSQESIRNQVRKELRAEAAVSGSTEAPGTNTVPEAKEEGSAHLAVPSVCFTCPLTGATLRKDQREAHIKEAILSHFSTDPVAASIMKIHTFNRDRDRVKLGVDTIAKYLDNICLHPEEEKYRKIKLQNRVFQERINCLEGTHEFFEAIGFQKALLPVPDQEGPEEFYVLSEAALAQPQSLQRHKEQLLVAEPVRATLARQRRLFRPSPMASQFDLPGDFFNLTAEEIKREQRLRSEAVERLSVLRTKAMREREEQRELRKYTYTLLRVRLPDGCLLQGTFYARERVAALYAFVREALQNDWLPFDLLASGGQRLSEEESLAFNECGLVPSALLTFSWDTAVLEDIKAAGADPDSSILKPELLAAIEKLS